MIKKISVNVFDREITGIQNNDYEIENYEIQKYIENHISKIIKDTSSKEGTIGSESWMYKHFTDENSFNFKQFSSEFFEKYISIFSEVEKIEPACGILCEVDYNEKQMLIFLKLDYQIEPMTYLNKDGSVDIIFNNKILPGKLKNIKEYFVVDGFSKTVKVSDTKIYMRGKNTNVLSDEVLSVSLGKSEKESLSGLEKVIMETIQTCYNANATEKILEFKKTIAEEVEQTGKIEILDFKDTLFADSEEAQMIFENALEESKIENMTVNVSTSTERKLRKKQRIITNNGIELLIPVDLLHDSSVLEYAQAEDGKISIIIKDIDKINNK